MKWLRLILLPSRLFFSKPLFVRENRIVMRRWYLWLSLFLFLWLPTTLAIRYLVRHEYLYTIQQNYADLFHYFALVIRPDLFLSVFFALKIVKTFNNRAELESLALTGLSPREIVLSLLAPYILIMIIFQIAGGPLSYYDMLSSPNYFITFNPANIGLGFLSQDMVTINSVYPVIFFAVIEDMMYTTICLSVMTFMFLHFRNIVMCLVLSFLVIAMTMYPSLKSGQITDFLLINMFPDLLRFLIFNPEYSILFSNAVFFSLLLPVEFFILTLVCVGIMIKVKSVYPPYK